MSEIIETRLIVYKRSMLNGEEYLSAVAMISGGKSPAVDIYNIVCSRKPAPMTLCST
jgi:hypothetical protein